MAELEGKGTMEGTRSLEAPRRAETRADNPNLVARKEDYSHYYQGLPKKGDWLSYYHQLTNILGMGVDNFVEIGGGSWVVTDFFRRRGTRVTTLDLNAVFRPQVAASVNRLPLKDGSTDCIVCCQVLEHLPIEEFDACLAEFSRVTRRFALISLPLDADVRQYRVDLPKIHFEKFWLRERTGKVNALKGYHYWEMGRRGTTIGLISARIGRDWKIRSEYVCKDNPVHYFFSLEKKGS